MGVIHNGPWASTVCLRAVREVISDGGRCRPGLRLVQARAALQAETGVLRARERRGSARALVQGPVSTATATRLRSTARLGSLSLCVSPSDP